jgi:hypothetical protein
MACLGLQVLSAEDEGKPKVASIAEALPSLQQAMALSLPCREMCEAIVATCGCGQQRSFGELLDKYIQTVRDLPEAKSQSSPGPSTPHVHLRLLRSLCLLSCLFHREGHV